MAEEGKNSQILSLCCQSPAEPACDLGAAWGGAVRQVRACTGTARGSVPKGFNRQESLYFDRAADLLEKFDNLEKNHP